MSKFIDLTGKKFGRLKVIRRADNQGRRTVWTCECECGVIKDILAERLSNGNTQSCGCYHREISSLVNTKHGYANRINEYSKWKKMRQRCLNKSDRAYKHYGGRGIEICDRWLDFENFYEDMGSCPDGYSIERIDNNKGYSPDNCRWATAQEQARNRRSNHLLTYNGETKVLMAWISELNISRSTVHYLLRKGMPFEDIVNKLKYSARKKRNTKEIMDVSIFC